MTLDAAQQFIQRAVNDRDLVEQINSASDAQQVQQILSKLNLHFNYEEFEQAYWNVLTWCQTYQQAEAVKEIKLWWDFLSAAFARTKRN